MKIPAATTERATYVALASMFRAITDLRKPNGTVEVFGGPQIGPRNTYRYETKQELLEVTDDLIGAAFAIAQTYISTNRNWTAVMTNINHVANYWKHRDQWGPTWAEARQDTLAGVRTLGASPPAHAGQVSDLARACFPAGFDVDHLWAAINP